MNEQAISNNKQRGKELSSLMALADACQAKMRVPVNKTETRAREGSRVMNTLNVPSCANDAIVFRNTNTNSKIANCEQVSSPRQDCQLAPGVIGEDGRPDNKDVSFAEDRVETDQNECSKCRVKAIRLSEVPLLPVGLSLTHSGLKLFIKVDDLEEKQLWNIEKQLSAQLSTSKRTNHKSKRRKRERKIQVSSDTTEAKSTEHRTSKTEVNATCYDTSVAKSGTSRLSSDVGPNNGGIDGDDCDMCGLGKEKSKSQFEFQNVAANQQNMRPDSDTMNDPYTSLPDDRTCHRTTIESNRTFWPACSQSGSRKKRCFEYKNLEIETGLTHEHFSNSPCKKQPIPVGFTSRDLPLKRTTFTASCSDDIGPCLPHNASFPPDTQISKPHTSHAFCFPNNVSNSCNFESMAPCNFQRRANSYTFPDVPSRESSLYAAISTSRVDNAMPGSSEAGAKSPNIIPEPTKDDDEDMRSDKTPLIDDEFDPSKILSSGTIDSATLIQFSKYTKNMRRDLKQSYKQLSHLIKEFNDKVQSVDGGEGALSSDTSGEDDDMDVKNMDNRCVLM